LGDAGAEGARKFAPGADVSRPAGENTASHGAGRDACAFRAGLRTAAVSPGTASWSHGEHSETGDKAAILVAPRAAGLVKPKVMAGLLTVPSED